MRNFKKKSSFLALTLGDPCGIGPETTAKALDKLPSHIRDRLIVVGPARALNDAYKLARLRPPDFIPVDIFGNFEKGVAGIKLLDTGHVGPFLAGAVCKAGGEAAIAAIEAAHSLCKNGVCGGMVTGPIGKKAIRLAGSQFSGHTDMLRTLSGVSETRMAMVYKSFRVAMTTLHVAWCEVPALITPQSVYETLRLVNESAMCEMPHIKVAGLNPHAGENGLFGDEEQRAIIPAIERFKAINPLVEGPFPADTLFKAEYRRTTDWFVAQSHDQGLIAIKTLGGIKCVNVTLGLPYVRTSVGHGTAYDIAGRGIADHRGLWAAVHEAAKLLKFYSHKLKTQ